MKSNQRLEKILEEIETQTRYATEFSEVANPKTAAGHESRRQMAKHKLEDLRADYRKEITSVLSVILTAGSEAETVAQIAKESKAELQSLDSDDIYNKIVDEMPKQTVEKGENNKYIIGLISGILEKLGKEIGIASLPMVLFSQDLAGQSTGREEILNLTKVAVKRAMGTDLAAVSLMNRASDQALAEKFDGNLYPAMVIVKDTKELKDLEDSLKIYGIKSIIMAAGESEIKAAVTVEEVSEEGVLKALKQVRNKLK